jgi:hypothetical protein
LEAWEVPLTELDNPAARVEAVLRRAEPFIGQDVNAKTAWLAVFHTESDEDLMSRCTEFVTQIRLAREAIERLPEDEYPEHLLEHFPLLEKLPGLMFAMPTNTMSSYRTFITPTLIYSLGACARALRRNGWTEPTLDDDGINELLETINDILIEVAQSALPKDVKIFVVQRLRDVEAALRSYQISGYAGLEITLDALIGSLWRAPNDTKKPVGNWFMRLLSKVESATKTSAQIATSTQKAIESVRVITESVQAINGS